MDILLAIIKVDYMIIKSTIIQIIYLQKENYIFEKISLVKNMTLYLFNA